MRVAHERAARQRRHHRLGPINLSKATGPGSKYRENLRCKEWEEMMDADFHGGWTELSEVHSSEKQWNTALQLPMQ